MNEINYKKTEENDDKESKKKKFFSKLLSLLNKRIIKILVIILVLILGIIGIKKSFFTESKTTKLGFEDIGELATESCVMTEIDVVDKSRKLYGVNVPFTQTKYIYSYDVIVKAGIDFSQVDWDEAENNTVNVIVPEVKVLSKELKKDSFKVYHEEESIFTNVTLEENNKALTKLEDTALKDAIDNGLYDRAKESAKKQLKSFIKTNDKYKNYKIHFEYRGN